eukprot:Colp12_sorted_trinity150504_noHs@6804
MGSDYNGSHESLPHIAGDEEQALLKKDQRPSATRSAVRKLVLASVLCLIFMVGEIVGGLLAHSLAILTDAAHMLSDLAGFMISLFAIWIAQKPASTTMSFGFHRAEIIGAILSVLLIWALTGVLIYEAVDRVMDPPEVDGLVMFITAIAGVAVNIFMGLILGHGHSHGGGGHGHGESDHGHSHGGDSNINVRAAYIHVLGDLLQSVGVTIASIIIWVKPEYKIADPICTFIFAVLVLFTTINILRDALHVLMEGAPKAVNITQLKADLVGIKGVVSVHDMHVWSLTMGKAALACHLDVNGESGCQDVLAEAQSIACNKYHIHHTTFQIESVTRDHCATADCSMECQDSCKPNGRRIRFGSCNGINSIPGEDADYGAIEDDQNTSNHTRPANDNHGHSHGNGHGHSH